MAYANGILCHLAFKLLLGIGKVIGSDPNFPGKGEECAGILSSMLSIESLMCRDPPVIRCMQTIYHLIYVCCPPSARRLEISSPLRLKSGTTCNFALQKKCLQPTGLPACNLYHLRRQFASPGPQVIAKQRKRVSQEGLLGAGLIESGTRYGGSP